MYTTIKSNGQLEFGLERMSELYLGKSMIRGVMSGYKGNGTFTVNLGNETKPICEIVCIYTNGKIDTFVTAKHKTNSHYKIYKHLENSITNTLKKNDIQVMRIEVVSIDV